MHAQLPGNEAEIDAFLAAFKDGTLPKERWTHGAHLLTGACYVHALGEASALERIRDRVSAYNVAVGGQNTATSGYHETITVFWIKLLARLRREHTDLGRAEFALVAVATYEDRRNILWEFYGLDVVQSQEARRSWIPPELQRLD